MTTGVDAVFDAAGGGALPELIELRGGTARVVTIADDAARQLGVTFSTGAGFNHNPGHIAEALHGVADGSLRVRIADTFPLDCAAEAHRIIDAGHPGGKLLLHP